MFFFFFQAEDGIRDYKVTGVQTCALPILCRASADHEGNHLKSKIVSVRNCRAARHSQLEVTGRSGMPANDHRAGIERICRNMGTFLPTLPLSSPMSLRDISAWSRLIH